MSDKKVTYRSSINIERQQGPLRLAWLPAEKEPVRFGTHGAIAEHYGVDPKALDEPHATTIDYVIAATGGWLLGTLGGALEARQVNASEGRLSAEVTGEVEAENKVLVIRRIHVSYRLKARDADRDTVERVHDVHRMSCPLYRTLHEAIEITTELNLEA